MTIINPDFLLIFNETSGTTATNYGSQTGGYTIQQGTSPTDYTWNPGAGSYDGYLDIKTKSTSSMPYLTTAATTPGTTLEAMNFAIGFELDSFSSSGYLLGTGSSSYNFRARAVAPTVGGDFNLEVNLSTTNGFKTHTFTALTFGTFYALSASYDPSTIAATQVMSKLGAAATIVESTYNDTASTLLNEWPRLGMHEFDFTAGLDGRLHYFAWQRGGAAWSSTDLTNINSNPKSYLTGWPGGGASVAPIVAAFYQNLRNNA